MRKSLAHLFFAMLIAAAAPASAQNPPDTTNKDTQWAMSAKDAAATRFSPLAQINATNAGTLRVAWEFSFGSARGQEAAPIVIGTMMVVVGAYPNEVFALDAVSGDLKWKYSPRVDPSSQGVACCDVVNRGAAYDNGKLFFVTLDDHAVALDAKTGRELWVKKLGDISRGETMSMAPTIVKGHVLLGISGDALGVRGWLAALDESNGAMLWRAFSTGPDKDVLIGAKFHPYYKDAQGKDLGVSSWPVGHWQIGGGSPGAVSFDPKSNLIFYGTGNPAPWNANQRAGDNLWASTIFARDADTGEAVWADVLDPHDLYAYGEANENTLLDLPINRQTRPVLVHAGRNGLIFVIDRATGQIYSADTYGAVTATDHFDLAAGRPAMNQALEPAPGRNISGICPATPGLKGWEPSAFSPATKLIYLPLQNLCMDFKANETGYIPATPYVGAILDMYAAPKRARGALLAWDPAKRAPAWSIAEKFPLASGTMATAGNIVVYGTLDRWFKIVDARDGKLLYRFHAPSGFVGQPVTYQGSDGKQYIAITDGVGGWAGEIANSPIDPHVRNGALGYAGAVGDLPAYTSGGGDVLVFALPEGAHP